MHDVRHSLVRYTLALSNRASWTGGEDEPRPADDVLNAQFASILSESRYAIPLIGIARKAAAVSLSQLVLAHVVRVGAVSLGRIEDPPAGGFMNKVRRLIAGWDIHEQKNGSIGGCQSGYVDAVYEGLDFGRKNLTELAFEMLIDRDASDADHREIVCNPVDQKPPIGVGHSRDVFGELDSVAGIPPGWQRCLVVEVVFFLEPITNRTDDVLERQSAERESKVPMDTCEGGHRYPVAPKRLGGNQMSAS